MCKGMIGKKLGMTGLFTPDGSYVGYGGEARAMCGDAG
jgi:hypothetical protein